MRILILFACCLALNATVPAGQSVESPSRPGDPVIVGDVAFVPIPAGEFSMGDDAGHALANERPVHRVKLDAFWMARTEITFMQWKTFRDDSGYPIGRSRASGNDHPVVGITWDDARAYAAWFSKKYGVVARLPTEAEWEYAAR